MPETPEITPTAHRPLLVGLLIDVSGSMTSSIQNRSGESLNRLEGFERSLGEVAAKAKDIADKGEKGLIKVFAYGFGFGNILSAFLGGSGPKVQDILRRPGEPEAPVALDFVADKWEGFQNHVRSLVPKMFGDTPMMEGFRVVMDRFARERKRANYAETSVLFVLSDGEPTDVNDPKQITDFARELKEHKVVVISCYVTDANITESRHLYGHVQSSWPQGARLMFECASALPTPSPFESYMMEHRWKIEKDGRLFTQVNQSEILAEFLSVITSPLEPGIANMIEAKSPPNVMTGQPSSVSIESPFREPESFASKAAERSAVQKPSHDIDRNRLFTLITNWTFFTGIAIGVIGLVLIVAGGPSGESTFNLFGQQFKSVNVGVAALFIAVVMIVLNIRRLLGSVDRNN